MHKLFEPASDPAGGTLPNGGGGATAEQPWHSLVLQGEGEAAKLNDPAQWLDKAPPPLSKFIKDQMTAARAKTEGMVRVPGENATPDEIAAYYKAIGVPDKPEDYGLQAPAKLPEGVQHDAKMEAAFLEKAREMGLNAKQVQALRDFQLDYVGQTVAASRAEMAKVVEAEKAELKTKFGDKLDATIADVKALVNAKWVPEGMKKYLTEGAADPQSGQFAGADFLEFAAAAARAAGEDRGAATVRGSTGGMSIEEAKIIMGDSTHPQHAKWKAGDPELHKRISDAYNATMG
jgi:hypothetical protein